MILHLPLHCNVCHTFLLTSKGKINKSESKPFVLSGLILGQFCSNCGIGCCIQPTCVKKANAAHQCKTVSLIEMKLPGEDSPRKQDSSSNSQNKIQKFRHHWIHGNVPLHSECEVCEELCGDGPGIVDVRCCWCQRYF